MLSSKSELADGDCSVVAGHLPKALRRLLRALVCIKNQLRSAFAILKNFRGTEARENYYALCTDVVPMYAAEWDRSGMIRRVAEELEPPRALGSVPYKQQAVRAAWRKLVENSEPIAVGEQVELLSLGGPGRHHALRVRRAV
jgi:hypothetical protein